MIDLRQGITHILNQCMMNRMTTHAGSPIIPYGLESKSGALNYDDGMTLKHHNLIGNVPINRF